MCEKAMRAAWSGHACKAEDLNEDDKKVGH